MKTVLIIDDDIHIGNMLKETLEGSSYSVLRAYSGTEALLLLKESSPDLILLDLMLPGLSGEELLPKIKDIPVIVLSAKADEDSKVKLLLGGARDYVTKPFSPKELLARISVILRQNLNTGTHLHYKNISLGEESRTALVDGCDIRLTRTEYAILHCLLQSGGAAVSKSAILERISRDTPDCTESSLKIHISNLRKKLREAGADDPIEAVWGIGFRLKP